MKRGHVREMAIAWKECGMGVHQLVKVTMHIAIHFSRKHSGVINKMNSKVIMICIRLSI